MLKIREIRKARGLMMKQLGEGLFLFSELAQKTQKMLFCSKNHVQKTFKKATQLSPGGEN